MPIVVSKSHRWRVFAAHGFLLVFLLSLIHISEPTRP